MESFSGKVGWVRKGEMEDGRKGGEGGELLLGTEEGGVANTWGYREHRILVLFTEEPLEFKCNPDSSHIDHT